MLTTHTRIVWGNSCGAGATDAKMPPPESNGCSMSKTQTTDPMGASTPGDRLRFECVFVSAWLAVGLFVVPE